MLPSQLRSIKKLKKPFPNETSQKSSFWKSGLKSVKQFQTLSQILALFLQMLLYVSTIFSTSSPTVLIQILLQNFEHESHTMMMIWWWYCLIWKKPWCNTQITPEILIILPWKSLISSQTMVHIYYIITKVIWIICWGACSKIKSLVCYGLVVCSKMHN